MMVTRDLAEAPSAVIRRPRAVHPRSWLASLASSRLVRAVLLSRLLVLAGGAYGAIFLRRVHDWYWLDPTRLTTGFGTVGNALAGSTVRWDSIHYLSIAEQGYKPAGDTGFFPFYPLLIRAVGSIVPSDVIAGLLISAGAFVIALVLLHRIAREELGERVADATVLLLAFAPLTLFFTAIYTESVFLALSVGTFYLARSGRIGWACVTAACGAITHVEGITLWAPVAYMFWESHGRRRDLGQFLCREAAGLLLAPAAFLGLLIYLHAIGFGWLAPFTGGAPTGHGHTIAPILPPDHSPEALTRTVAGPLVTIWHAFLAGGEGIAQTLNGVNPLLPGDGNMFSIGFQNMIYLIVLVITLAALVGCWRILPRPYAIYATLVVLVFTGSVVNLIPLRSFDRYMLPIFPLWIAAAKWLVDRNWLRWVLVASPCLIVLYTAEFARWVLVA